MESLLLTAAAVVALGGALFHGYVGGKIYMGHVNASADTIDSIPEPGLLAHVHRFFIGEWRHPYLRGDEARLGTVELPHFASECARRSFVSANRCDGTRQASETAGSVFDVDDRAVRLARCVLSEAAVHLGLRKNAAYCAAHRSIDR